MGMLIKATGRTGAMLALIALIVLALCWGIDRAAWYGLIVEDGPIVMLACSVLDLASAMPSAIGTVAALAISAVLGD